MNIRKQVLGLAISSALMLATQAHAGLLGGAVGGGAGGALNGGVNGFGTLGAAGQGTLNGSFGTNLDTVHSTASHVKQKVDATSTTAVEHVQQGTATASALAKKGVEEAGNAANSAHASAQLAASSAVSAATEAKQASSDLTTSVSGAMSSGANAGLTSAAATNQAARSAAGTTGNSMSTPQHESSGITSTLEQNTSATGSISKAAQQPKGTDRNGEQKAPKTPTALAGSEDHALSGSAQRKPVSASGSAQGSAEFSATR